MSQIILRPPNPVSAPVKKQSGNPDGRYIGKSFHHPLCLPTTLLSTGDQYLRSTLSVYMYIHVVFHNSNDYLDALRRVLLNQKSVNSLKLERSLDLASINDSTACSSLSNGIKQCISQTVVTSTNYSMTTTGDANLSMGGVEGEDDVEGVERADRLSVDLVLSAVGPQSTTQIDRAQEDLSSFKRRIDANTEEQREHAEMMAALQRKVEEYRRRVTQIESEVGTRKAEDRVSFAVPETNGDAWNPVDMNASGADYRWEEQYQRAEELRIQLEQSRMQTAQLQGDNQNLQRQFQVTMRDKEKNYQMREKHLSQYLSEEQRKMMDLWTELQQVRRQFEECKEKTERDLDCQRNEFVKMLRSVGSLTHRLSNSENDVHSLLLETTNDTGVSSNQDPVLVEAIKRFREQKTVNSEGNTQLHDELMKKYEEAIDRIIELESRGDGSSAKVSSMEAELRRTKAKLSESQEVLRKLHDLAREAGRNPDIEKRARSLSPTAVRVVPSEVLRSVRYAIRSRDNTLQQLKRKLKIAETEIAEMRVRSNNAEDACRRLEKQLAQSKKELNAQMKSEDCSNRELKRLEDRLKTSETDRQLADANRRRVQVEIRNLKLSLDRSVADSDTKAAEDFEEKRRIVEEEYTARITELTRRIESLVDNNKRLKTDLNGIKDNYKSLEMKYSITMRNIDDKDKLVRSLEHAKVDLMKNLEDQRDRFDAMTSEMDNLQTSYSTSTKNTVAIEVTVKEIKHQRDEISIQRNELARELTVVKRSLEEEAGKREQIRMANQLQLTQIERFESEITEYESQLLLLRRHNDDLDTQTTTCQAKMSTLENSLSSAHTEITKLTELNKKLQMEKQEIMSTRKQLDGEMDAMKERIRKMDMETEKLRNENRSLAERGDKVRVTHKEEEERTRSLRKELEDAKVDIDELQRRLKEIDDAKCERLEVMLNTKTSATGTYESTEVTEIRVKEMDERYNLDLNKLENERDELSRRVQTLKDEAAGKDLAMEQRNDDIDALKAHYQMEIDRLKAEITNLETQYESVLDDERDQNSHNIEAARANEDELRGKIAAGERKLAEVSEREKSLEEEARRWEQKHVLISKDLDDVRDELEALLSDSQTEIRKWKNELESALNHNNSVEATVESLKAQLAGATDRTNSSSKTISEQTAKIRELNAHVRRVEEEWEDSKVTITTMESHLESALSHHKSIEDRINALQIENAQMKTDIESLNRQLDSSKNSNKSLYSESERLRKKMSQLTTSSKEQSDELTNMRTERDQLDKMNREKSRQIDKLNETLRCLDSKTNRMRKELQEASDKLIIAETDRNSERNETNKLQQEVNFGKEQMMRKTNEFHSALEELAAAHRVSEDGRVNTLQELESRKFEVFDLQSRLDNSEQRLVTLQQEFISTDKERDVLNDSLRRFYVAITRTMSTIPEGAQLGPDDVDTQTIDVHVQKLMSRVENLEREKNEYRDAMGRLKRKTSDSSIAINKHETLYRTIEEKVIDSENERRAAETRLTSAKQLLRSQEEALKTRDEERCLLKSKIVTFELEARGKDAQLRHLNEVVRTLRSDLERAQADVRTLRDKEEQWDTSRFQFESKMRDRDGETQRLTMLMAQFEVERQSLNDSLKKLSSQLQNNESKNVDMKEESDQLKRAVTKAEKIEKELRRSLDEQKRLAQEIPQLKEQLNNAQTELGNANSRKATIENELSSARSGLREFKQRLRDAANKLTDSQRQLQDSQTDKNRLNDRIFSLEKTVSSQRDIESDLHNKLSSCSGDSKALQLELDQVRSCITQSESSKRLAKEKIDDLSKIRVTLLRKMEILEKENQSAESYINETVLQREAIERSLSALEHENKELCRSCTQLQQQIAKLEMDNGNRLIALTNKQREEHERFVQSVRMEKVQVERIVENRDRTQKNRIKQLENQLNIIREQLNSERARRREASDRAMVSDMSKLGASVFGFGNTGIVSAGATYPLSRGYDFTSNNSAYSSRYASPPSFKLDPRIPSPALGRADFSYRNSPIPYLKGEPLETVQESYTSTMSMNDSSIGRTQKEERPLASYNYEESTEAGNKTTTIVVHMKGTQNSANSDVSN